MNWYKKGQSLTTLNDRNLINHRIKDFEHIGETLKYLSQYVFQNAIDAQKIANQIADSKQVSSFPILKEVLKSACSVARDSYKKFSNICEKAVHIVYDIVEEMKEKRNTFTQKDLPDRIKKRIQNG